MVILVVIISGIFYVTMFTILNQADQQFLNDETTIIQSLIDKKPTNLAALKQEIVNVPESLNKSFYHYYVRIYNPFGSLVLSTPDSAAIFKHKGTNYLFHQAVTDKDWRIEIALDISYQNLIIHKYQKIVFLVLFCGVLLSLLSGFLITLRGLKSLTELTHSTRMTSINNLQQRLNPQLWPKELRELGSSYNQMLERIEEAMIRLVNLSDDMAHELRTPITNLMGETEIALSNHYSDAEYRLLLESNLEELHRIYQIIENLLFLARAENPQFDLPKSIFSAEEEIQRVCQYYEALAEEKGIWFVCEGNTQVTGNVMMFRRMMSNLLSNAIHYSFAHQPIKIMILTSQSWIEIQMINSGKGIEANQLPHLFERFYRADNTQGVAGCGLGLSIVKSIVKLHKGSVAIASEINRSTVVTITLPK